MPNARWFWRMAANENKPERKLLADGSPCIGNPQIEETYLVSRFLVSLALVLGAANHPRGTSAVYFNLGPEQATAQCFSGGIRAFLAMACTHPFMHISAV